MVDTEVKLNRLGLDRYTEMDNKKVIDVVGIGLKHLPLKRVRFKTGNMITSTFQIIGDMSVRSMY